MGSRRTSTGDDTASTNESNNSNSSSKMSHQEIDEMLAAEISASPCTADLFYALMNGQSYNEGDTCEDAAYTIMNGEDSGGEEEKSEDDLDISIPKNGEVFEAWNDDDVNTTSKVFDSSASIISDMTEATQALAGPFGDGGEDGLGLCDPRGSIIGVTSTCSGSTGPTSSQESTSRKSLATTCTSRSSSITFGAVQVRYYERIIDINPAVSSGVALGLGWRYKNGGKLSLDEYELQRGGVQYAQQDLVIPREVRESIVKDYGFSEKQIASAIRLTLRLRNERKQTIQNLPMQKMEERIESVTRKIVKFVSKG